MTALPTRSKDHHTPPESWEDVPMPWSSPMTTEEWAALAERLMGERERIRHQLWAAEDRNVMWINRFFYLGMASIFLVVALATAVVTLAIT